MDNYICVTCGTQFAESLETPQNCPICEDERQYVGHDGQKWTTLSEIKKYHTNRIEKLEDGLFGIGTEPKFGIGQRALLIQSNRGNVLWDCISLIDDETIARINELGGISAIAVSHPHYYSSMVEWAEAFDAKIYIHEADKKWVMRPDPTTEFWKGDKLNLNEDITLICCGGHFDGGAVCHWSGGANGKGALLTGDIIQVVADRRWVSFMYSYPNYIPLSASEVSRIVGTVDDYSYDCVYGAFWGTVIPTNAKERVKLSADRYIRAIK